MTLFQCFVVSSIYLRRVNFDFFIYFIREPLVSVLWKKKNHNPRIASPNYLKKLNVSYERTDMKKKQNKTTPCSLYVYCHLIHGFFFGWFGHFLHNCPFRVFLDLTYPRKQPIL